MGFVDLGTTEPIRANNFSHIFLEFEEFSKLHFSTTIGWLTHEFRFDSGKSNIFFCLYVTGLPLVTEIKDNFIL